MCFQDTDPKKPYIPPTILGHFPQIAKQQNRCQAPTVHVDDRPKTMVLKEKRVAFQIQYQMTYSVTQMTTLQIAMLLLFAFQQGEKIRMTKFTR